MTGSLGELVVTLVAVGGADQDGGDLEAGCVPGELAAGVGVRLLSSSSLCCRCSLPLVGQSVGLPGVHRLGLVCGLRGDAGLYGGQLVGPLVLRVSAGDPGVHDSGLSARCDAAASVVSLGCMAKVAGWWKDAGVRLCVPLGQGLAVRLGSMALGVVREVVGGDVACLVGVGVVGLSDFGGLVAGSGPGVPVRAVGSDLPSIGLLVALPTHGNLSKPSFCIQALFTRASLVSGAPTSPALWPSCWPSGSLRPGL